MKAAIFCAAVLLVSLQLASAQAPKYVAANIVESMSECPVKNQLFDKKIFDVRNIYDMQAVLMEQKVSEKCIDAATIDLAECFNDGPNDADRMAGSSLDVQSGCCTKKCADGIKKAKASGCLAEYVKAVCAKQETVDQFGAGLLNSGTRCADFSSTCPGMKLPPGVTAAPAKPAAGPAKPAAGNSTAAAAPAATTEKAPAAEATPAASSPPPAEVSAPSPAPSPRNSSSTAVATSFAAVVMAAGAVALAL